jgi:Na+/pantothenate symporter
MKQHLDFYDYTLILLIFSVSILIGLYHGFKRKLLDFFSPRVKTVNVSDSALTVIKTATADSIDDYLQANSSMGFIPITFSLLASFFSATALLGKLSFTIIL